MITVRRGTFETNSSSTHSFSISKNDNNFERLQYIFNTILYGDEDNWIVGIDEIDDETQLFELLKLLNEAQQIIMSGTEDYD